MADDQFAAAIRAGFQPTDDQGNVIVKKAQPAQQNVADIKPDMNVHDPVTYGSLTADHTLRQIHAQGLNMTPEDYLKVQEQAAQDARNFQAGQQKTAYEKQLEEAYKVIEAAPGGLEQRKAQIAAQSAQIQKQEEQGPGPTAEAIQEGVFPGQSKSGISAQIFKPSEQQQKDWPAYVEGFHNLQTMHQLFDNMATKTFGAGGPFQSAFGMTKPIIDKVSPEARLYNSYVESSLVPIAKSIMGDAATTAGKDTIQAALRDAFPNESDTGQTGGQKMFNFYQRALDKMQTERDFARKNGVYTGSIDTALNDFHSFFNSDAVQKYNPQHNQNQPLVGQGNSPQAQQQLTKAIYSGTGQTPPNVAQPPTTPSPGMFANQNTPGPNWWNTGNQNMFQGMQAAGAGTGTAPEVPSAAEQELVNLPGQFGQTIKSLMPKPGGEAVSAEPQISGFGQ